MTESVVQDSVQAFLHGASAGALSVVLLRYPRIGSGLLTGAVAALIALATGNMWGIPTGSGPQVGAVVTMAVAAGVGHERVRSRSRDAVADLALLVSLLGVWLAVPENGPAVLAAGTLGGLWLARERGRAWVGVGPSGLAAWAVLVGYVGREFALVGGLGCLSVLAAASIPLPVRPLLAPWPWFVLANGAVAFASARWIGVAPGASWTRVGLVASAAVIASLLTRPQAQESRVEAR